jgi:excisionase family DNA binding protein
MLARPLSSRILRASMKTAFHDRLTPSLLANVDLNRLCDAFSAPKQLRLLDKQGRPLNLPDILASHLVRLTRLISEGQSVMLVTEQETLTTQVAATYLGMSRQHLVNLLESGKIPFRKVGTHRRVVFKDLLEYEKRSDTDRHDSLNRLSDLVANAGYYDASYTGNQ